MHHIMLFLFLCNVSMNFILLLRFHSFHCFGFVYTLTFSCVLMASTLAGSWQLLVRGLTEKCCLLVSILKWQCCLYFFLSYLIVQSRYFCCSNSVQHFETSISAVLYICTSHFWIVYAVYSTFVIVCVCVHVCLNT